VPAKVIVANLRLVPVDHLKQRYPEAAIVDTCKNITTDWQSDLSPFVIGPCDLYGEHKSILMENGWQFSKVYKDHLNEQGDPTEEYFKWAEQGWADPTPKRYPMGKGRKPQYSYWNGEKLYYIAARKRIYAPLYARAVQTRLGWELLKELYQTRDYLVLRDYDGYDHIGRNMSLTDVLNNHKMKMGHAFVLAMLLQGDPALKECGL
jgi:hypothetical protein